jgi:hypothetical protein
MVFDKAEGVYVWDPEGRFFHPKEITEFTDTFQENDIMTF